MADEVDFVDASPATLGALMSTIVCLMLYKLSGPVSGHLFKAYGKLSGADRRDWDTRVGSTVHSMVITAFATGIAIMQADEFFSPDHARKVPRLLRTTDVSFVALGVSFGYFMVDLALVCWYYSEIGGAAMLSHHIAATISVAAAITTGNAHILTLLLLATEVTTPFINLRWYLDKLGMKSSQLYRVNGLLIMLSWLFARVLFFFPFFWFLWSQRDVILTNAGPFSQLLVVAVPLLLCALNLVWFWKIIKGVIKLFAPSAEAKGRSPAQESHTE